MPEPVALYLAVAVRLSWLAAVVACTWAVGAYIERRTR